MTNIDSVSQFNTAYYVHCICIVIGCFNSFLPRFCGAFLSITWIGYYALMYISMPMAVTFSYWLIVYLPFAVQILFGFDNGTEYLSRPWLRALKLLWNTVKINLKAAAVNSMMFIDSNLNEFHITIAIMITESLAVYDVIRLVITTIQSRAWIMIPPPFLLFVICRVISKSIAIDSKRKVNHYGNKPKILDSCDTKVVEYAQFGSNGKSVAKLTQSDSGYPGNDEVLSSSSPSSKQISSPPSCLYPEVIVVNHCSKSTDSLDTCSYDRNAPTWSGKDRGFSKPTSNHTTNDPNIMIAEIVLESSETVSNVDKECEFANEKKKKSRKKKLLNFFKGCFCLSS